MEPVRARRIAAESLRLNVCHHLTAMSLAGGSFGLRLVPPLHETGCPGVDRLASRSEVPQRLFTFRVQACSFEDSPVAEQRHDYVIVVDAQVVDAGLGDLHGLAGKAGDDAARHDEANDLVRDGPECLA